MVIRLVPVLVEIGQEGSESRVQLLGSFCQIAHLLIEVAVHGPFPFCGERFPPNKLLKSVRSFSFRDIKCPVSDALPHLFVRKAHSCASVHLDLGCIVQEKKSYSELGKPTVLNVTASFVDLKKDIA
jgi:hypothetical protein